MNKPVKPRKRWKKALLCLVLLLALGLGAWSAYDALKSEYTVTYDAYTASVGSISNALSFSGNLQLQDSATYTAAAATTVRGVYVREGDTVQKGDRLLRLANGETITADFTGRVNQLYVSEGDSVEAGASLLQLADFEHMKVSFRVDEYDISDVKVGDTCRVTVTATGQSFESAVTSINYISASAGNVAYYTATALMNVNEGGVYPGMQISVTLPKEAAEGVVVLKADALSFTPENSAFVYTLGEDGAMAETPVEVGVSNGNYVEIKSGLKAGDTAYVEAQSTEQASGLSTLLSGMFGSTQMNAPRGGENTRRQWNNEGGGQMPSGSFPGGGMPDRN